jgi:outer membrane lipoprotein-sorting protein
LFNVAKLVENTVKYLRGEGIYVLECKIKEKATKFEINMKLDKNPAGLSYVKIQISKDGKKIRVFTRRTSFDLRIKRFIRRELEKMAGYFETTSQEEDTGSS